MKTTKVHATIAAGALAGVLAVAAPALGIFSSGANQLWGDTVPGVPTDANGVGRIKEIEAESSFGTIVVDGRSGAEATVNSTLASSADGATYVFEVVVRNRAGSPI